jgi:hypothetical protein
LPTVEMDRDGSSCIVDCSNPNLGRIGHGLTRALALPSVSQTPSERPLAINRARSSHAARGPRILQIASASWFAFAHSPPAGQTASRRYDPENPPVFRQQITAMTPGEIGLRDAHRAPMKPRSSGRTSACLFSGAIAQRWRRQRRIIAG